MPLTPPLHHTVPAPIQNLDRGEAGYLPKRLRLDQPTSPVTSTERGVFAEAATSLASTSASQSKTPINRARNRDERVKLTPDFFDKAK